MKSNKPDKKASPARAMPATAAIATPNPTNSPNNPKPVASSTLPPSLLAVPLSALSPARPSPSPLSKQPASPPPRSPAAWAASAMSASAIASCGGVQAGSYIAIMQGIGATGTLSTGLTLGAAAAGGAVVGVAGLAGYGTYCLWKLAPEDGLVSMIEACSFFAGVLSNSAPPEIALIPHATLDLERRLSSGLWTILTKRERRPRTLRGDEKGEHLRTEGNYGEEVGGSEEEGTEGDGREPREEA
jgi:hypothetical protein